MLSARLTSGDEQQKNNFIEGRRRLPLKSRQIANVYRRFVVQIRRALEFLSSYLMLALLPQVSEMAKSTNAL